MIYATSKGFMWNYEWRGICEFSLKTYNQGLCVCKYDVHYFPNLIGHDDGLMCVFYIVYIVSSGALLLPCLVNSCLL